MSKSIPKILEKDIVKFALELMILLIVFETNLELRDLSEFTLVHASGM